MPDLVVIAEEPGEASAGDKVYALDQFSGLGLVVAPWRLGVDPIGACPDAGGPRVMQCFCGTALQASTYIYPEFGFSSKTDWVVMLLFNWEKNDLNGPRNDKDARRDLPVRPPR